MANREIAELLKTLRSPKSQEAWSGFLQHHAPLILQVVQLFERDADHASDCFLYVCEALSQNRFQRIQRFKPDGTASFPTWLRAVVRHLCLDWHRREFGRARVFQSIARLSTLEQEIFQLSYRDRLSPEEILRTLRGRHPDLGPENVTAAQERIEEAISPRQRWLLVVRAASTIPIGDGAAEADRACEFELADPAPSPESLAVQEEERKRLASALQSLPPEDRLLLRLRFAQDLTLEQVGRLTRVGGPQAVDRRIREVLDRLRKVTKLVRR